MKPFSWIGCLMGLSLSVCITASAEEYLVKFRQGQVFAVKQPGSITQVSKAGNLYRWVTQGEVDIEAVRQDENVEYIQPNYKIRLLQNPSLEAQKAALLKALAESPTRDIFGGAPYPDNPEIESPGSMGTGTDPQMTNSWGLHSVKAPHAWSKTAKGEGIIVAVTDSGIDYNHEDLIHNMWRNTNEIPNDGIDNDENGYIDDVVGWDFVTNDNKPYDYILGLLNILMGGGHPGHGTHCAGVIAAANNNGKGSAGIAPKAKLMALRFLSEKGQGDTAGGIAAIDYAIENGAHIINASWGSEGEQGGDQALKEAIQRAEDAGVIFVAAAGNGRIDMASMSAKGYDNDNDPKPAYPASYAHENIIAVSALDVQNQLAVFSNWGLKSVDLGAPGVKVLSTVPGSRYEDTIINLGSMVVTWDGTSMAAPHVAGAAALLWSANRDKEWNEVLEEVLKYTEPTASVSGKVVTGGRLDLAKIR